MSMKWTQLALEWILVGLMVGIVMFLGWRRMHQLDINGFLLLSYGVILCLIVCYRSLALRLFPADSAPAGDADNPCA